MCNCRTFNISKSYLYSSTNICPLCKCDIKMWCFHEQDEDASWGNFVAILRYKAERAGRIIIEVDLRNTSKTCSGCGNVKNNLSLKDREYQCEICGLALDRDLNAAKKY